MTRMKHALFVLSLLFCTRGLFGFAVPEPGHKFEFPKDHGAHPNFRIEWWYLTGHLGVMKNAEPQRRFGFQATFFRLAGEHVKTELHLAHMAVTDVQGKRFLHEERLNRAGWDAHAAVGKLDIANGPWTLTMDPAGAMHLDGSVEAHAAFKLTLRPTKPLVVFGKNGVSRKGKEADAASYYLTFSRLAAQGSLRVESDTFDVAGEAWMDHEISSSQLGSDQVGWDWTCIQLGPLQRPSQNAGCLAASGSLTPSPLRPPPGQAEAKELMLYRMRLRDGSADPASILQWVDAAGHALTEPFTWKVLSTWKSPHSHATYPARIELGTVNPATHKPVRFELIPLLADQELTNSMGGGPYWEGACKVLDADTHRDVGSAYLELTGYAKALRF